MVMGKASPRVNLPGKTNRATNAAPDECLVRSDVPSCFAEGSHSYVERHRQWYPGLQSGRDVSRSIALPGFGRARSRQCALLAPACAAAVGDYCGRDRQNGTYTPVYRYTLPDGQSHEAKSDTSSSGVGGKETGRIGPLMIFVHNYSLAREANEYTAGVATILILVLRRGTDRPATLHSPE
jgi:hypothetical protein